MKLYLIRHGETTYNLDGRIQGHSDAPLTSLGINQARLAALRISNVVLSAVYSSDLARAKNTASLIAAPHNLPVKETSLIRERNFGVLQGLTRAQIEDRYPVNLHSWRQYPQVNTPPGAESDDEVVSRCAEFLDYLKIMHQEDENVAIVCHGGSLRALIISACNLPVATWKILRFSNGSLSIVEFNNTPAIWLLNETDYLNESDLIQKDADNK